jgi:RNA polymerase sigma factor (sigma-70 family)
MTWCRAAFCAPSPSSICGSQEPIWAAWLFTIFHNQYVNVRRSAREGVTIPVEDVTVAASDDVGAALQLRDLEWAIASLSEGQRQVILLLGLEGMRYEEVAAILGIPVGTVRSRLSRGRDMLRALMNMKDRRAQPQRGTVGQLQAA